MVEKQVNNVYIGIQIKGMYISAVIFYHDEVSISVTVMIGIM